MKSEETSLKPDTPMDRLIEMLIRRHPAHPETDRLRETGARLAAAHQASLVSLPLSPDEGSALLRHPAVGLPGEPTPFHLTPQGQFLWHRHERQFSAIAARINELRETAPALPVDSSLSDLVLARAAEHRFLCLTGGPGTGKSTTLVRIAQHLPGMLPPYARIALAAPTGKAAARLASMMPPDSDPGASVQTLHRLLGASAHGAHFQFDPTNPLPVDAVLVDEASMLDLSLLHALLRALPREARLILCGDPDQLPAVGLGSPFADIVAALEAMESPHLIPLTTPHRFSDTALANLARVVREGCFESFTKFPSQDGPVCVSPLPPPSHVVANSKDNITTESSILLTPTRYGPWGTENLNRLAFPDQNPAPNGMPLILTQNLPEENLFNGDMATVATDSRDRPYAIFDRGAQERRVPLEQLPSWLTAHALTVHRSQGSEFDHVTVVIPPDPSPFVDRRLLYTAVTRARRTVTVLGDDNDLRAILERDPPSGRGPLANLLV